MEAVQTVLVTDAQHRQFREQGFFITEPVFDQATLASVREAFEEAWKRRIERHRVEFADNPAKIRLTVERPFLQFLQQESPVCAGFLKSLPVLEIARKMIGPDADVLYNQAVIKAPAGPEASNAFAWHQDSYYACRGGGGREWDEAIMTDGARTYQSWIAITRTTVENGTLWVLPGGHRDGFVSHERHPVTGEFMAQIDTTKKIPVLLEPGQMLIFSGMLPHCSGPNTSNEVRMVYQFSTSVPGGRKAATVFPMMRGGLPA